MCERVCGLLKEELKEKEMGLRRLGWHDEGGNDAIGERRKWSVKRLATEVGVTESHFCRVFKKVMGMTVGEYRSSSQSNALAQDINGDRWEDAGTDSGRVSKAVSTPAERDRHEWEDDLYLTGTVETCEGNGQVQIDIYEDVEVDYFEFVDFGAEVV